MDDKISEAISELYLKVVGWIQQVILMLPNLLIAVVVFLIFYTVARQARRILSKALAKFSHSPTLMDLLTNMIFIGIVVIGLFISLSILQLDKAVTSLLAGAGIIGLALGFAFQDIAANFVAGVLLAFRRPIQVGDMIESKSFFGTVTHISLSNTIIRTPEGQHVFIPNKEIYNDAMINYSTEGLRRVDLKCGVSYGEDLEKVKRVAMQAIQAIDYLEKEQEVSFYYQEFGDSSINFTIRYWIKFTRQPDYLGAMSDGIMRIKSAFDREGIAIPYPIRTLDFGIKGGEPLAEQLHTLRQSEPGRREAS